MKPFRILLALSVWIAAAGAIHDAAWAQASNSLQQLDYAILPGGRIAIKLAFRNEIRERPPVVAGYYPAANIVLDLADTASELPNERAEIGHRVARSLQVLTAGGRTRVVISLNRPVSYDMALMGRELLLTLDPRAGN
jgi:type IV pilus assembly protein PilQ